MIVCEVKLNKLVSTNTVGCYKFIEENQIVDVNTRKGTKQIHLRLKSTFGIQYKAETVSWKQG